MRARTHGNTETLTVEMRANIHSVREHQSDGALWLQVNAL